MHTFNFNGYALEEKTVGRGNASSSRVNLPLSWVGKKVAVVLLEEINKDKTMKFFCMGCGNETYHETDNEYEMVVCNRCGENMCSVSLIEKGIDP